MKRTERRNGRVHQLPFFDDVSSQRFTCCSLSILPGTRSSSLFLARSSHGVGPLTSFFPRGVCPLACLDRGQEETSRRRFGSELQCSTYQPEMGAKDFRIATSAGLESRTGSYWPENKTTAMASVGTFHQIRRRARLKPALSTLLTATCWNLSGLACWSPEGHHSQATPWLQLVWQRILSCQDRSVVFSASSRPQSTFDEQLTSHQLMASSS